MNRAWSLVKTYGLTLSNALKKSWAVSKLRKAMRKGIQNFTYRKVNGEIRTAWGTLSEAILGAFNTDSGRKPNPTLMTYYDTEKRAWRSFKLVNLISVG